MTLPPLPRLRLLAVLLALAPSAVRAENPAPAKGVASVLQPFVDEHALAGAVALVADKDRVLSLEAVGYADVKAGKAMRTDAVFWIASQSKSITAAALMMLVDEGKVKLDDPVEKYLPEFKDQWLVIEQGKDYMFLRRPKHPITVRNVLSHTSGLPFASAMEKPTLDLLPLRDAVRSYAMTPLQFEPGSEWRYSNAGINTAGRIIEVVSGMPYEDFLDKHLFRPLGMKDTTFWPNEQQLARLAKGYKPDAAKTGLEETKIGQLHYPLNDRKRQPMPAGGLFSTAEDVGRFCQMMLNGGTCKGERLLSEAAVKEMTTKQTGEALKEQYGLGWATGGDTFGHGGAFATNMTVDPKRGLITVYMVQHAGFPKNGGQAHGAFQKAAVERFGQSPRGQAPDAKGQAAAMKPKPRFPIGRETTYVLGPVEADGHIDYASALNERLSKGVTPENNANVLIWKALGPHPEGSNMPPEYFKWLGIEQPPERGDYFIPQDRFLRDYLKRERARDGGPGTGGDPVYDELQRCTRQPWTAKEHPDLAAWLKANEKPIALVIEATKRPRYFSPLTPKKTDKGSAGLIGALLPAVQKCRELASALTARAMLAVAEGRTEDAWRDLLACHRLGRLVAHGATLIEALVGIAIDTIAARADLAFLEGSKLDSKGVLDRLGDLRKLPPMPPMADKVDVGERFMSLDCVMLLDRGGGIRTLEALADGRSAKIPGMLDRIFTRAIDWEPALRILNRWYDRLAKAMRIPDRAAREKELDALEKGLKKLKVKASEDAQNPLKFIFAKDTGKELGETIGNIMVCLLIPAVRKVQAAGDRTEQVQDNLYLAFALAAYRADYGGYPAKLAALAPRYLDKIPQDLFAGKPLVYRPDDKGYLLYSVGVNGRDEEGRSYDDDPRGDDLTVRMPPPKARK